MREQKYGFASFDARPQLGRDKDAYAHAADFHDKSGIFNLGDLSTEGCYHKLGKVTIDVFSV